MRKKVILILKQHPMLIEFFWRIARIALYIWGIFVPVRKKTMLFCSFGGRRFDDSPKAIYDEVCNNKNFDGWHLIWAFVDPSEFDIPRGEKIKIDTFTFFYALLYSRVWVSNSGMDRGIELHRKKNIIIETWHGTPIKKILGDENKNPLGKKNNMRKKKRDASTIRCAQSEFDKKLFERLFHAESESILLCDLPRNDSLLTYTMEEKESIKERLGIDKSKKVILYTPTYREYLIDAQQNTFITPPIDINKWRKLLGEKYVLLIRAHYAVSTALNIKNNDFVKDVSNYPVLNELYIVSDMMISDYSSTFFDYSILGRPEICFAYDLKEYSEKRGLYFNLSDILPCKILSNENQVLSEIMEMNYNEACERTEKFRKKYVPYAGHASKTIVNQIIERLKKD